MEYSFDKSISLDKKYPAAFAGRGGTKLSLGDWEGAIKDYFDAILIAAEYNRSILAKNTVEMTREFEDLLRFMNI